MDLSIVIPAYNESLFLRKTLSSISCLLADTYKYEVIVVDNGSDDDTAAIARSFLDVRVIELKRRVTVAAARNAGWNAAESNSIIFLDSDITITRSWCDQLANILARPATSLFVTGATVSISTCPSWLERNWFGYMDTSRRSYVNSANLLTNKNTLLLMGGFQEDLVTGEDVAFSKQASAMGAEVELDSRLAVEHEGYPKTFLAFARREVWHGTGDVQNLQTLLDSPVAMIAMAQALIIFGSILLSLVLESLAPALTGALLLCFVNLAISCIKFRRAPIKLKLVNAVIYFVYFVSRSLSPIKLNNNRRSV